jgi:arginyl-tRNA synthetase
MTIKSEISKLVSKYAEGVNFDVLSTPSRRLGDYSVNLAFRLEKEKSGKVMEWAEKIKTNLESDNDSVSIIEKVEITEPGFVNIFLKTEYLQEKFLEIVEKDNSYGQSSIGDNRKINLEFVSANPTGPMTVHNVRAAAYGDTLGNVFKKCGYDVTKEYYINDVGVQVQKLGKSVLLRLKELKGEKIEFEEGLYKGDYVVDLARKLLEKELPTGEAEQINFCRDFAVEFLIKSGQNSMTNIGVNFDVWFRESQLHSSGEVPKVLDYLKKKDLVYEKDGASWFKVSNYFPDQQDAVVVKSDGSTSYLMNDIAYTKNKIEGRGFDRAINIWGTDHHGDKPRLLAGAKALGYDDEKLEILLHQLIMVKEKDEYQRMSKREGKFVLLDDFAEKVSKDAIRFFFIAKDMNTHMEFDVDLAKEQSKKNPIFYAQYAFARLNGIFDKAGDEAKSSQLRLENDDDEMALVAGLVRFSELIEEIGESYRVHHLAEYVLKVANDFHKYYESHHILQDDKNIQGSRLVLAKGVQVILKNCFDLMGISAPLKM